MIPLIVSLLAKYLLGDWDKGYQWTINDLCYWASLVGFSALTLFMKDKWIGKGYSYN